MIFPLLVTVAALAAGGPAEVDCVASSAWKADPTRVELAARVGFDPVGYSYGRKVVLSPYACGGVTLLAADPANRTHLASSFDRMYRESIGLFVLLHEAGHVSGIANERGADCFALRHYKAGLRTLGVPTARGRLLYKWAVWMHSQQTGAYAGKC